MTEPASRRHLVLIGLMGVGKTTVGERCAHALGRPFCDVDELVVASSGHSVTRLFELEGERGFRERERRALADACGSPAPLVIACGGGAVLDAANRATMRATGFVVWLRATPGSLAARVGDGEGRPLLAGGTPVETLQRLATVREPAYRAAADVAVDTDGLDAAAVADEVLEELARCAA